MSLKMEKELEELKIRFLKIFSNLPEDVRKDIIAVIDKKPYNWDVAYIEIKNDTDLGRKILKTLKDLAII